MVAVASTTVTIFTDTAFATLFPFVSPVDILRNRDLLIIDCDVEILTLIFHDCPFRLMNGVVGRTYRKLVQLMYTGLVA